MLKVDLKVLKPSLSWKVWFCDPSLYQIVAKKHPIWKKLGALLAKFSKMHPIFQIVQIGSGMENHPSIYQNWWKSTLKTKASQYTINQWEWPLTLLVSVLITLSTVSHLWPKYINVIWCHIYTKCIACKYRRSTRFKKKKKMHPPLYSVKIEILVT